MTRANGDRWVPMSFFLLTVTILVGLTGAFGTFSHYRMVRLEDHLIEVRRDFLRKDEFDQITDARFQRLNQTLLKVLEARE